MSRMIAPLLLLLAMTWPTAALGQQMPDAPDVPLTQDPLYRGDVFYYEGDFYRAITQYEIYLMGQPPKDAADAARLKIGWLYAQADKLPAAAEQLSEVISTRPEWDRLAVWGRLYYADLARRAGKGSAAVKTYERLIDTCDALVAEGDAANAGDAAIGKGECLYIQSYARVGLARYYSTRHEFDKAVTQLEEVPDNSPIKPKAQATAQKVNGLELPRKSPVLAGALSVVPGLGHFYIEEYGAGVAAILWNGVFIYAFVDSIVSRRYGQAALIGLVESIWYSGTIFGAISGAHRFNRDARRIVEEGMTRELNRMDDPNPWPARFPTPRQGVQFQLEWTF